MASKIVVLEDLVPLEILEDILTRFTKVTGMATLVTDYRGRPITTTDRFTSICKKIREIPELRHLCVRSDATGGFEAANRNSPFMYLCYAGMVDVCIPIIIDGHYLGAIFTGQVLLKCDDMPKVKALPGSPELDYSQYSELDEVKQEYLKTHPKLSFEKLEAYVELLSTITNYIVDIGYKSLLQEELRLNRIKLLEEQEKKAVMKESIAQLELRNMQSQVNPFFLFNTFNSIHRQAILENADKTSELIQSMTNLLRRSLDKTSSFTTIEEEIDYINNFILIKNTSSHKKIKFTQRIAPQSLDCSLPFFAIQAFVENFFLKHFETFNNDCTLNISASLSDGNTIINISAPELFIETNSKDKTKSIKNSAGKMSKATTLTVENVIKILEHYYSDSFSWDINSSEESGTAVVLSIPCKLGR